MDGEWYLWTCQKHLMETKVLQNWNSEFSKWLNPKFYATIQAEKKPCHQNSLSFEMKLGCKEVGRLFLGLSYICLPTHIHTTKVCTILVWYYIEGADQENESIFCVKNIFFVEKTGKIDVRIEFMSRILPQARFCSVQTIM